MSRKYLKIGLGNGSPVGGNARPNGTRLTTVLRTVLVAILMSRGAAISPEVCTGSRRCGRIGVVGVGAGTTNRIRGNVVADVMLIPPVRLWFP